jgi:hypothetical protein
LPEILFHTEFNLLKAKILISNDNQTLCIKRCDEKLRDRFSVPQKVYEQGAYRYTLQKYYFIQAIQRITGWDSNNTYRIDGAQIAQDLIKFSFKNAIQLNKS